MSGKSSRAALEGITLETMVTELSVRIGWEAMAEAVPVRCFTHDPSVKSSLKFLRRTPWARDKVEALYLREMARVPVPNRDGGR
ncbi:MAG: DUF2132 domain-containing protein [Betaproteobacteria bacterium]|nr:DUF2132 domain-containing protein [Betaproteobacteria bacterium]